MPETLTAAEIEQLDRFDEHWRVILAGDDAMMVQSLPKRGYLRAEAPGAAVPA